MGNINVRTVRDADSTNPTLTNQQQDDISDTVMEALATQGIDNAEVTIIV